MKKNIYILWLLFCFVLVVSVKLSAQAPFITSFTPASGPVGTLVNISGISLDHVTAIQIAGKAAITISSYDNLLVAMVMPGATTGPVFVTTTSGTDSTISTYTVTASKPPTIQLGGKITGTGNAVTYSGTLFGIASAISANGNTAIIGGSADSMFAGAAWVFTRVGSEWIQQGGKLTHVNPDGNGYIYGQFGQSVAISADGNTAIVGAPSEMIELIFNTTGAAYIYSRNNAGIWTEQFQFTHGINFEGLGKAVALSADANIAVVGSPGDSSKHNFNGRGATWVFARDSSGIWNKNGIKLVGTGAVGFSNQGAAISMSADGKTIVTGGPGDNGGIGAVWVFARMNDPRGDTDVWLQQGAKLVGTDYQGKSAQGYSVAISADGNTIAVGGPSHNRTGAKPLGAVWVFVRDASGSWTQQGPKLVGDNGRDSLGEGHTVSISADGNTIMLTNGLATGGTYVFKRVAGVWTQYGRRLAVIGATEQSCQCSSASISADGKNAMVGNVDDHWIPSYGSVGAAWAFVDSAGALPVTFTNFTAYPKGKGVLTQWTGYNEINLQGYDVEKSATGAAFTKLANVPAKGSSAENAYTWFDGAPYAGDNYYRIKAISKDGSIQYSHIVKVNIGNTGSSVQMYPNPAVNKTLHLQLSNVEAGTYAITMYNAAGQKVYSGSYVHAGGTAQTSIQVKNLATGVYQVTIQGVKTTWYNSIVVQ